MPDAPAPESVSYPRPRRGKTRQVWDIADDITREKGRPAVRAEVRKRVVAVGGNANTANTQYQYWKSHQQQRAANSAAVAATNPHGCAPQSLQVAPDGRLLIPGEMRAAMQLDGGGRVIARVENGELRVAAQPVAIRQVQERLRKYRSPGQRVVDEFLAERRAMWGEE